MTDAALPGPRVVYFTRFRPDPCGGGGSRRAAQAASLLEDWSPSVLSSARLDGLPPAVAERLRAGFKRPCGTWVSLSGLRGWQAAHRPYARRQDRVSRQWARRLGRDLPADLLLLDDPLYFPALVRRAQRLGIPAAAVCHNQEGSLAHQVAPRALPRMARREFDLFRRCSLAITIAAEDAACLEREGVRVFYWPYFPAPVITARLEAVRRARGGTVPRDVLLLGSCANAATRRGILEAARWWAEGPGREGGDRLRVAGFGSDRHLGDLAGLPGVDLLGPLPDAGLDAQLTTVRAALCHQAGGGGALTRVVEFLLAGVPVIASRQAARSWHGTPGVLEYTALDHVPAVLASLRASPPVVPVPDPPDPAPLRDALAGLLRFVCTRRPGAGQGSRET
ncbi:MAG: hypothetical protein KA419_08580 [Acidobacteria bacterium]|nr:hypothetical protein [Acidobacteriota bacterium]